MANRKQHVTREPAPQTIAFRIRRDYEFFVPELIDARGGVFEGVACRCADQAAYSATRGGTRKLEYRGMYKREMVDGALVDVPMPDGDSKCTVDPAHWTWQHHGFTHGTLAKQAVPA